jgi:hypothetical protein
MPMATSLRPIQGAHGQGVTARCQDHRRLELQQPLGQACAGAQQLDHRITTLPHHRQVEAGGELAGTAGDDHHLAALPGLVQGLIQLLQHVKRQGIGLAVIHVYQDVLFLFSTGDDLAHESRS